MRTGVLYVDEGFDGPDGQARLSVYSGEAFPKDSAFQFPPRILFGNLFENEDGWNFLWKSGDAGDDDESASKALADALPLPEWASRDTESYYGSPGAFGEFQYILLKDGHSLDDYAKWLKAAWTPKPKRAVAKRKTRAVAKRKTDAVPKGLRMKLRERRR